MSDRYRVDALAKAHTQLKAAIKKLPNRKPVLSTILARLESGHFDFGEELYNLKSIGV
jgi:hypothetical protein